MTNNKLNDPKGPDGLKRPTNNMVIQSWDLGFKSHKKDRRSGDGSRPPAYYPLHYRLSCGRLDGAKVLGKLLVPGRSTNLDNSRISANCACGKYGWGLFGLFFSRLSFFLFFLSLWETARYRLEYCLKGLLNPKQSTNQPLLLGENSLPAVFLHLRNLKGGKLCYFCVYTLT